MESSKRIHTNNQINTKLQSSSNRMQALNLDEENKQNK